MAGDASPGGHEGRAAPVAAALPDSIDAGTVGVRRCETCALVLAEPLPDHARCPRCGAALHRRKPRSIERTLAWLLTAVLLYIPANLLPVMSTQSVFGHHEHTLAGGIRDLWIEGSRELSVIVFVASIAVPIVKIVALALLAVTAARASRWRQRERAVLYRLVETVGHWSMLDVFVVVLLVGMVRFGALAGVEPEAGLAAFGGVVVATMLASSAFDPRLIWPGRASTPAAPARPGGDGAAPGQPTGGMAPFGAEAGR